jgi:hypothetical protein
MDFGCRDEYVGLIMPGREQNHIICSILSGLCGIWHSFYVILYLQMCTCASKTRLRCLTILETFHVHIHL